MISESTINRVKESVDVVEVIQNFVTLKRSGQVWFGLSPFKAEKTPSFAVYKKGFFRDFSSGESGDVFTFLRKAEGMHFPEAIRYLAELYNIPIQETIEPTSPEEEAEKAAVLADMKVYWSYRVTGWDYMKGRDFTEETLKAFGVGYAPAGYTRQNLQERIIFPIHNTQGKVVAFGGRAHKDGQTPKYVNSPDSPVYHKSRTLFGLKQNAAEIRKLDRAILVEGYTDVMRLWQSSVKIGVASCGTAFTPEQARILKRYTANCTVAYDGDAPGKKATLSAIQILIAEGFEVNVIMFPSGDDPDSYVRKNGLSIEGVHWQEAVHQILGVGSAGAHQSCENIINLIPSSIHRQVAVQDYATKWSITLQAKEYKPAAIEVKSVPYGVEQLLTLEMAKHSCGLPTGSALYDQLQLPEWMIGLRQGISKALAEESDLSSYLYGLIDDNSVATKPTMYSSNKWLMVSLLHQAYEGVVAQLEAYKTGDSLSSLETLIELKTYGIEAD